MAVQTKRKTSVKKEPVAVKYERLQLRHWVMFWVLVAATHALVIAIFSNVDVRTLLPVNVVNDEQKLADQALINDLKAQVKSLKEKEADSEIPLTSESPCTDESVFSDPDSYVTYRDEVTGIQIQLPYNQNWGGDDCRLSAFSARSATGTLQIDFGPSVPDLRGGWERISFTASSPTSSAVMLNEIRKNHSGDEIVTRTVNGIPVYQVIYAGSYDPASTSWYAVGRNYLFSFRVRKGALSDAEAIKIIQSLRVTK